MNFQVTGKRNKPFVRTEKASTFLRQLVTKERESKSDALILLLSIDLMSDLSLEIFDVRDHVHSQALPDS